MPPESWPVVLWASLLTGAAGVALLRRCWRRAGAGHRATRLAAWSLLGVSLASWILGYGAEFGASYALAWFTLCGCAAVAAGARRRAPARTDAAPGSGPASSGWHKWLTFVAAGPLAGAAACLLTLLLTQLLPLVTADRVAVAVVLFPLLWAGLSFCSVYSVRPARNALAFSAATGLCGALLFLIPWSPL
ncbi:MAG: hypothetical protein CME59_20515 [Halioglobus sp.]|nr:hypothetical protein [Halioglobus sp.]|tara:strand:+ start:200 stop:769 length:570 start_codon:yes stop_codon:yes gene_type:complete